MYGHNNGYGGGGQFGGAMGGGGMSVLPAFKPVGIFWDIENCPVGKGKSASSVIHFIRNFFVVNRMNHREYEFLVACDVTRTKKEIAEDINRSGGVTLAHVNGDSKNAADEKLRESMKRFVDTHAASTPTLILISGDIDFVNDLRAYQTRLGCQIIILHGPMCSQHFKTGWNEIYAFETFLVMMDAQPGGPSSSASPATNNAGNANKAKTDGKNKAGKQGGPKQGAPNGPNASASKGQAVGNSGGQAVGNNGGQAVGNNGGGNQKRQEKQPKTNANAPGKSENPQVANTAKNKGPSKAAATPPGNQPKNRAPGTGPSATINPAGQVQGAAGGKRANKKTESQDLLASLNQLSVQVNALLPQNVQQQAKPPQPPQPECILMVTGLPGKMDYRILKDHLQAYASQVSGKVKYVHNGQGFITFSKKENAMKAIELFNGMEVYGKKLSVQFSRSIPFPPPKAVEVPPNGTSTSPHAALVAAAVQNYFAESAKPLDKKGQQRRVPEEDPQCNIQ